MSYSVDTLMSIVVAIATVATLANYYFYRLYSGYLQMYKQKIDDLVNKVEELSSKMDALIREHTERISKLEQNVDWLMRNRNRISRDM